MIDVGGAVRVLSALVSMLTSRKMRSFKQLTDPYIHSHTHPPVSSAYFFSDFYEYGAGRFSKNDGAATGPA